MQKNIIFGGVLFLAYYIYKRVRAFDYLAVRLVNVSFQGSIISPVILFKFALQNNSDVAVTISNFSGGVFINGTNKVAEVNYNERLTIAPNKITFVTVPVTSFLPSILNNLAIFFSKKLYTISLSGFTTVDGLTLPVNVSQDL